MRIGRRTLLGLLLVAAIGLALALVPGFLGAAHAATTDSVTATTSTDSTTSTTTSTTSTDSTTDSCSSSCTPTTPSCSGDSCTPTTPSCSGDSCTPTTPSCEGDSCTPTTPECTGAACEPTTPECTGAACAPDPKPNPPGSGRDDLPFTGPGDVLLAIALALLASMGGTLLFLGASSRESIESLSTRSMGSASGFRVAYRELLKRQLEE